MSTQAEFDKYAEEKLSGVGNSASEVITAVPDFLRAITRKSLWERIGVGILGAALILLGFAIITKATVTDKLKDVVKDVT